MLFFSRPDELVSWLRSPERPLVMTDVANAYGYAPGVLASLEGVAPPERINVGITALDAARLNWSQIERWTYTLLRQHGSSRTGAGCAAAGRSSVPPARRHALPGAAGRGGDQPTGCDPAPLRRPLEARLLPPRLEALRMTFSRRRLASTAPAHPHPGGGDHVSAPGNAGAGPRLPSGPDAPRLDRHRATTTIRGSTVVRWWSSATPGSHASRSARRASPRLQRCVYGGQRTVFLPLPQHLGSGFPRPPAHPTLAAHPSSAAIGCHQRIMEESSDGTWRETGTTCGAPHPYPPRRRSLHTLEWGVHALATGATLSNGALLVRRSLAPSLVTPEDWPFAGVEAVRQRLLPHPLLYLPETLASFALTRTTARAGDGHRWGVLQTLRPPLCAMPACRRPRRSAGSGTTGDGRPLRPPISPCTPG